MPSVRFVLCIYLLASLLAVPAALAQSIGIPWSNLGHDSQHTAISRFTANTMNRIKWQTPVDLDPQYSGTELFIHYGSPLVTPSNTVILPVKTGAQGGFQVEAHLATTGSLVWVQTTDYILPAASWTPSCGITLTPRNRLFFPGAGGTVYYRDSPDSAVSSGTGQIAFYGLSNYRGAASSYQASVQIDTPLTSDRYGDVFFGFMVTGSNPLGLQSGIARIDSSGSGTWIAATAASGDSGIVQVVTNCAPALSNDHKSLYVAVSYGDFQGGYLVALDSRTLAPVAKVFLKDAASGSNASLVNEGTASPTIGPDGDVYYGVLQNPFGTNHDRGWMLHFNGALTVEKTPGAFGWDDSPSIVPAKIVPSYTGSSAYLLLTKYNNYAETGGNGVNKIAVLDPNATETDSVTGATVMYEVLTIAGVTPDTQNRINYPNDTNAVREWCINSAAIDLSTKCAIVNSEDGKVYRWDLTTNTFTQSVVLTAGVGEAYTPAIIGPDGTVYVINNATVFAVGP